MALSEPPDFTDKWEDIGYHRIIGGFFYNIIFAIVALGYSLILPLVIPFSESLGFYNILTGIFSSIFTFADLGLASALSRFIAEYRVKNPARSIEYIRFFILNALVAREIEEIMVISRHCISISFS